MRRYAPFREASQHYAIGTRTRPFHEHNEDREIERAIADLESGKRIAVISDAGTPLLSDPGFKLVRAAAAGGISVIPVPGASALLSALTASGLPTDTFFFAGFLPPKQAARRARLAELSQIPGSLVFYEAPHRVAETIADMAALLGGRQAVVARELTKLHEEISRGSLASLAGAIPAEGLKGEVVIVVGPQQVQSVTDEALGARLADALEVMSLKDAAKALADELGVPKARVYGLGIKAKGRPAMSSNANDEFRQSVERKRRHRSGQTAETIVAAVYMATGHRILGRRFKTPVGEIDLIAIRKKPGGLHRGQAAANDGGRRRRHHAYDAPPGASGRGSLACAQSAVSEPRHRIRPRVCRPLAFPDHHARRAIKKGPLDAGP